MPRVIGTIAVVIVVIVIRVFTVDSGDVVRFNERMVKILDSMELPLVAATGQFDLYFEGNEVNPAALKQAITTASSELERLNTELSSVSVPDDELCKSFFNASRDYATAMSTVCTELQQAAVYIETHNPPEESDLMHVAQVFEKSWGPLEAKLVAMQGAQLTMANKFKLKVQ